MKLIVIITVWIKDICHPCLFPTAGFWHHPSLIFVAFRRCIFFTAQNLLSNLSVKCLSSLTIACTYSFINWWMKSSIKMWKTVLFPPREGFAVSLLEESQQTFPSNWNPPQLCCQKHILFSSLFFISLIWLYLLIDLLMKLKETMILTLWFLQPWATKGTSTAICKLQET